MSPIGANRASITQVSRQLNITPPATALAPNTLAASVLREYGLEEQFRKAPHDALQTLHEKALHAPRRDLLLALSELNYIEAERLSHSVKAWNLEHSSDYFLTSAIYSWLYLFGPAVASDARVRKGEAGGEALDSSLSSPPGHNLPEAGDRRQATDDGLLDPSCVSARILYNYALARSLSTNHNSAPVASLDPGTRHLPIGQIVLTLQTNDIQFPGTAIDHLLFADSFVVRGLKPRNRQSGIGVPLIAVGKKTTSVPVAVTMPLTALLRLDGSLADIAAGHAHALMKLESPYLGLDAAVNGQSVPLEADVTVPLAYSVDNFFAWNVGREQFLSTKEQIKTDIYPTQPYQPGRIPILFVHGTFGSPAYWSELDNGLRADPELLRRCQFWHFVYNSGNAVPLSAARLRQSLTNILHTLDPMGADPALHQLVIIGHSQGGILGKLMVTDSEDRLWRVTHERSLEECEFTDAQRALARQFFFYQPLPEVRRVIFIATPHRGSNLAGSFSRWMANIFLTLPRHVAHSSSDLARLVGGKKDVDVPSEILSGTPTSVTSMSPNNPWLLELAAIRPAPGVKTHSIIAVKGSGDFKSGGDGAVKYASAHIDYADSEVVVRTSHRCQGNPQVIAEVRRILHEQLDGFPAPSP